MDFLKAPRPRGQCRWCPEVFPKFGDLIKHESTHPERHIKIERPDVTTNNLEPVQAPGPSSQFNTGPQEPPPPSQTPSASPQGLQQPPGPAINSNQSTEIQKSDRPKCVQKPILPQNNSNTLPGSSQKSSVASRSNRSQIESQIYSQMIVYDWKPDFIRLGKSPSGRDRFRCRTCSRVLIYHTKCGLNEHVFIHTGETPFSCQECSKGFRSKAYRDRHQLECNGRSLGVAGGSQVTPEDHTGAPGGPPPMKKSLPDLIPIQTPMQGKRKGLPSRNLNLIRKSTRVIPLKKTSSKYSKLSQAQPKRDINQKTDLNRITSGKRISSRNTNNSISGGLELPSKPLDVYEKDGIPQKLAERDASEEALIASFRTFQWEGDFTDLGRGKKRCNRCQVVLTSASPGGMKSHLMSHTGERPFLATFCCGKGFTSTSARNKHERGHLENLRDPEKVKEEPKSDIETARDESDRVLLGTWRKWDWSGDFDLEGKSKVKCRRCESVLIKGDVLRLKFHTMRHTGEMPFLASQCCNASFITPQERKSHELSHLSRLSSNLTPQERERDASDEELLSAIYRNYDWTADFTQLDSGSGANLKHRWICNECNTQLPNGSAYTLKTHKMKHTGERPFSALCCTRSFLTRSGRNTHEESHVNSGKAPQENQSSKAQVEVGDTRMKERARNEAKIFKKLREYDWSGDFDAPPQKPGQGEFKGRVFKCKTCNLIIKAHKCIILKFHAMRHAGDRPFPCSRCDMSFTSIYSRNHHEKRHPAAFGPEVEVAGSSSKVVNSRISEIKPIRTQEPNPLESFDPSVYFDQIQPDPGKVRCKECSKVLVFHARGLCSHRMEHTGGRPFQCLFCTQVFPSSLARGRHEVKHEENDGEMPNLFSPEELEEKKRQRSEAEENMVGQMEGYDWKEDFEAFEDPETLYKCKRCHQELQGGSQGLYDHVQSHEGAPEHDMRHIPQINPGKTSFQRAREVADAEIAARRSSFKPEEYFEIKDGNYKCRKCGIRLVKPPKSHPFRHFLADNGERPFLAGCCEKTFTRPETRDAHEKSHLPNVGARSGKRKNSEPGEEVAVKRGRAIPINLIPIRVTLTRVDQDPHLRSVYLSAQERIGNKSKRKRIESVDKSSSGPSGDESEEEVSPWTGGRGQRVKKVTERYGLSNGGRISKRRNGIGLKSIPKLAKTGNGLNWWSGHFRLLPGSTLMRNARFQCLTCLESTSYSNLRLHHLIHTGAFPYSCTKCSKGFRQVSHLRVHARKCHQGPMEASTTSVTSDDLTVMPMASNESPAPSTSSQGRKKQKKLKSSPWWMSHFTSTSKHARGNYYVKCKTCAQVMTRQNMANHIRLHKIKPPPKSPRLAPQNKWWLANYRVLSSTRVQCTTCGKEMTSMNMKNHALIHSGEKPHPCPHCAQCFRQMGQLRYHIFSIHPDSHEEDPEEAENVVEVDPGDVLVKEEDPEESPPPEIDLEGQGDLNSVKVEPDQVEEVPVESQSGEGSSDMNEGFLKVSSGLVRCLECSKTMTKTNMVSHRAIHAGIKPFGCGECPSKFRQRIHLQNHMLKIHGEMPSKAPGAVRKIKKIAPKKSRSRVYFNPNLEIVQRPSDGSDGHWWTPFFEKLPDPQKFKCLTCKQTMFGSNRRNHHMMHLGKSPFKCPNCEISYRTPIHLKQHLKTRHKGAKMPVVAPPEVAVEDITTEEHKMTGAPVAVAVEEEDVTTEEEDEEDVKPDEEEVEDVQTEGVNGESTFEFSPEDLEQIAASLH